MKIDTKEVVVEVKAVILRGLERQGVISASQRDLLDLARLSEFVDLDVDIEKIRDDLKELIKMDNQERRGKVRETELGC